MIKADFEIIARALRDARNEGYAHTQTCLLMAERLKHTNARFDKKKFLKLCGVTEELVI